MLTIPNLAGMDALRVHTIGDSITDGGIAGGQSPGAWGWADAPGGLYDQISPGLALKTGPVSSTRSGIVQAAPGVARVISSSGFAAAQSISLKPAVLTKAGVGGSTVTFPTQMAGGHPELIDLARWAEFVTQRADLFILQWAINDYIGCVITLTQTSSQHLTAYGAVLDKIHSDYPSAVVLCVGCLFLNEAWASTGGNHYTGTGFASSNPFDNNNIIDQNIRTCVAARPGWTEYCDLVTNALAYTVANTTEPGPAAGVGWPGPQSMNGLHPTLVGQINMGTWVKAHLNFVTS